MAEPEKQDATDPVRVFCTKCKHEWIGLYLPQPIGIAAKIIGNLTCPKCGTGTAKAKIIGNLTCPKCGTGTAKIQLIAEKFRQG